MTVVMTSAAKSDWAKTIQKYNAAKNGFTLVLTGNEMKFVTWLALSPEERVSETATLEGQEVLCVIAALSFTEKETAQPDSSASSSSDAQFSFSWGRRPG